MIGGSSRARFTLFGALALTLTFAGGALAALPAGHPLQPRLVGPEAGAVASASGLRFAWLAPSGAMRHVLVVSSAPFDARAWTRTPDGDRFRVLELAKPIASFDDLKESFDAEQRFYWAVGTAVTRGGPLTFSETRSLRVTPKFENHLAATPYLETSPITSFTPVVDRTADRIHLAAGYTIDPSRGEPALPAAMRAMNQPVTATRTYLMYYGAGDPEAVRQRVLQSGGTIVAYVPDHTFLVRLKPQGSVTLDNAGAWVGNFQPAYKISGRVDLQSDAPRTMEVLAFADGDLGAIGAAAVAVGGRVLKTSDNGINKIARIMLPGSAVAQLAQHPDVAWIEPYVQPTVDNTSVQWEVQTGSTSNRRLWDLGLHGEGQVLHHADSGIDLTHENYNDPAVPLTTFGAYPTHRKVIEYDRASDDPAIEFGDHAGASFHGSHTSGTLAGNDLTPPFSGFDGVAKFAKIWHSDMGGTALANGLAPPADLNDLFQPSYTGNAGGAARISTNSWGSAVMGAYTIDSYNVDQFMWNHPDYLIFFSNGNSSTSGTVGSPASAKDCVSVGGVKNGSIANENSLYTTTSRGPTADLRRKPTICAPASVVTSAQNGPANYAGLSGTSMASPAAAGMTALIRQYCTEGWYPTGFKTPANGFSPSAALLKSMVVNSGVNSITSPAGLNAPDNNIGYGRVCADSVLYFGGGIGGRDQRRLLLVDQTAGLGNGQSIQYHVNVVNDSTNLEVTLCWTDYPGNPSAAVELVNDLNLTVTNGVVTYKGNAYSAGFSVTGGTYDSRNVEEAVLVKTPAPGVWTIQVDGNNVPVGPQPFGLTITGGVGTNAGAVALDRASYGSGSTVQLRVTDTNGAATVPITVTSSTDATGETVNLSGANGIYSGTVTLSPNVGSAGDGFVQVSNGDVITATYHDANPVANVTQTAAVSFYPPLITAVQAQSAGTGATTVVWTTNTNANSRVYYGTTAALGSSTPLDPVATLAHGETITGLTPGSTYLFDVESQDLNGNVTRDDNGGQHYRFTVRPPGDLLVVYNASPFERPQRYDAALNELGWFYDTWSGTLADNPAVGNLTSGMRSYDVVWWQPGLDQYPPVSDAARDSIDQYLAGGGRFAIEGQDLGWALAEPTSPYYTPQRQAWLQNSLRSTFVADPPAWTQVIGVSGDPISDPYTAGLPYQEPRAGASGDEVTAAGDAFGSWLSGDGSPATAGVRWESPTPVGSAGAAKWGGQATRLEAMFFEWTNIDFNLDPSSAVRRDVLHRTLTWLMGRDKPTVTVGSPNGGEVISAPAVNITWTEAADGATITSRIIEYSPDNGVSWVTVTPSAGPSPYNWNVAGVGNTASGRIRIRVKDNGTPALSGFDVSDAVFSIVHAGGDGTGPAVVAGSIQVNPNPIVNTATSSIAATLSDVLQGGSNVTAAEWSSGAIPAPAGAGHAMTGGFTTSSEAVTATIPVSGVNAGNTRLWVRGRDAAGNWGSARALDIHVNGNALTAVGPAVPREIELRQNAPNPVQQSTTIVFGLPATASVRLSIYDIGGRKLRTLVDDRLAPGMHSVRWDRSDDHGRTVQPGVYYSLMDVDGHTFHRKIVTLR